MIDATDNWAMEGAVGDVTILILSLNRAKMLREALVSALGQTLAAKEIIILDNGSKDDVRQAVEDLCSGKVRWEGAVETHTPHWNTARGLEMTRTKYVLIMHDDDILDPAFLEAQMAFLSQHPEVSAVGCNGPRMDIEGKDLGVPVLPRRREKFTWYRTPAELALLYSDGHLLYPSLIYRRDAFDPKRIYEEFGKVGDSRLLFDVIGKGPIVHHDSMLYRYRIHNLQDSARLPEDQYRMKDRFLIEVSRSDPKLARKVSKNVYRMQTRRYLERIGGTLMKRGVKAAMAERRICPPEKRSVRGYIAFVPLMFRKRGR